MSTQDWWTKKLIGSSEFEVNRACWLWDSYYVIWKHYFRKPLINFCLDILGTGHTLQKNFSYLLQDYKYAARVLVPHWWNRAGEGGLGKETWELDSILGSPNALVSGTVPKPTTRPVDLQARVSSKNKHSIFQGCGRAGCSPSGESEVAQLGPTLCDPMDCSPPGSSIHGILQARILEWVALSFSRGSSRPRDRTHISCIAGGFFTTEPPGRV